jgi:hypothetical protein
VLWGLGIVDFCGLALVVPVYISFAFRGVLLFFLIKFFLLIKEKEKKKGASVNF